MVSLARSPFPTWRAVLATALFVAVAPAGANPVGSSAIGQNPVAYLPALANFPVADQSIAFELTPTYFGSHSSAPDDHFWRVTASLGLPYYIGRKSVGLFVEPKLLTSFHPATEAMGSNSHSMLYSTKLSVGLSLGYRFPIGPVHLIPVVGGALSYSFGFTNLKLPSGPLVFEDSLHGRWSRATYALNVNLLRVGLHW